eukprot:TRINITY_DN575_c0_g1_i1.p1 TRINITY_DN575_c0_g1~~TRINITY_DN575_c0_g1_i1.p1  ORF type:complete len:146 (+),score=32.46 TRINITY_DN575_c0_g1_i1:67-504(+)
MSSRTNESFSKGKRSNSKQASGDRRRRDQPGLSNREDMDEWFNRRLDDGSSSSPNSTSQSTSEAKGASPVTATLSKPKPSPKIFNGQEVQDYLSKRYFSTQAKLESSGATNDTVLYKNTAPGWGAHEESKAVSDFLKGVKAVLQY